MHYNTLALDLKLPDVPFLLDIEQLYAEFANLPDLRHARGRRYSLRLLLLLALLAKFAGQHSLEEVAHWAKAHAQPLFNLLDLTYRRLPHAVTYSRVLGEKLDSPSLELILGRYFTDRAIGPLIPARGTLIVSIDGKTLRGTIPTGQTKGVHLMAAFLPGAGVVLFQIEVGEKTNEITAAPKLLQTLDLRGMVVTGDAMQTQRALSAQIVAQQGDYLWFVKENQPGLYQDIVQLFEEEPVVLGPGFSPPPSDFEVKRTIEKGHGRLETRTITTSALLAGVSDWPYLAQVFKLEREWTVISTGEVKRETRYGLTSLPRDVAGAGRLMQIARAEWGIENSLHWVRDVVCGEDHVQVRRGHSPQVLAALNNALIGIMHLNGVKNIAEAQRDFGYKMTAALQSWAK